MGDDVDEKIRRLEKIKISEENSCKKLLVSEEELEILKNTNDKIDRAVILRQKHLKRLEDQTLNLKMEKEKYVSGKGREESGSSIDSCANDNNLMNMVQLQANLYSLRDAIKSWERKVEIAELVSKNKSKSAPY